MAIVKSFELALKEVLYRYNARVIFEYDKDYKYMSVKALNDNNEVLLEVPNTIKSKIVIDGKDLYPAFPKVEDMVDTPPEFNKILRDNFWDLI